MEPLALASLVRLARMVPPRMIGPVSGLLGRMAAAVPGRSGNVFRANRRNVAVPQGMDIRLWRIYRNLLVSMMDFLRLDFVPDETFGKLVEVKGGENMASAMERGRGVIAVTAHFSAWELIPRAISLMGYDTAVVTRKLGSGKTTSMVDDLRSRHGIETIDRGSGLHSLMGALRRGAAVGILIDQDTLGVESGFVNFLGLPARTPVGPAKIALRFDVPVLTLHISGRDAGRYLVEIDEPLDLDDYRGKNGYLELTADLTARIEEWIREEPEQWIWIHDRWARRPCGAPGLR